MFCISISVVLHWRYDYILDESRLSGLLIPVKKPSFAYIFLDFLTINLVFYATKAYYAFRRFGEEDTSPQLCFW